MHHNRPPQQQSIGNVLQALAQVRAFEMRHGSAQADTRYQDLIKDIPNNPEILIAAARQLASFHHYDEVRTLLSRVADQAADNLDVQFMLGHLHFLIEQPETALSYYEPLLQSDMARAPLLTEIGIAHASLGNTTEACRYLTQALEADDAYVPAIHELAMARGFAHDDPLFVQLKALRTKASPHRFDWNARLAHATGIACAQLGRSDEAFAAFSSVGSLLPPMPPFNEQAAIDIHLQASTIFDATDRRSIADRNNQHDGPIFIVGMPRSGTTLTEQILLGCSNTISIGEAPAMIEVYTAWTNGAFLEGNERSLENLTGASCLKAAGQAYLSQVERYKSGAGNQNRIIDKTPTNYVALSFIRAALPSARIVHCQRDPLDVCWSAFTTWFRTPTRWSHDLVDIGRFYGRYYQLMQHWRDVAGEEIYELSYENLVTNADDEARRLTDYCGLKWDEKCLDLAESRGMISTPSMVQARKPIYATSVKRYEPFLEYLGPLIETLRQFGVPMPDNL